MDVFDIFFSSYLFKHLIIRFFLILFSFHLSNVNHMNLNSFDKVMNNVLLFEKKVSKLLVV